MICFSSDPPKPPVGDLGVIENDNLRNISTITLYYLVNQVNRK